MKRWILTAAALLASLSSATACDEKAGSTVAAQIAKDVNALADFTSISCMAAREKNLCSIVCISTLRVPKERGPALLTVLLASSGVRTRAAGIAKFGLISFMDKTSAEARAAYQIQATRASEVQSQIAAGKIPASDMAKIAKEFAVVSIKQ